jgi:DNA-binding winged helix-turn-helix (wHTH) protein
VPVPQNRAAIVSFGIYEADLRTGELRRNGTKLKLQEKPFQILSILLEKPRELITRDELRERLWPSDTFVDFDHGLNTAVNKLREVLGDSANNPRFIETLPRRGYRFIADIRPLSPTTPEPIETPASQNGIAPASPSEANLVRISDSAERAGSRSELPSAPRATTRTLLAAMQTGYLAMYITALHSFFSHGEHADLMPGFAWLPSVLIWVAIVSIPVRMYLLFAIGFDYPLLSQKFRRLFPVLLVLDEMWSLAPFWIALKLGIGITFAAVAAFVYLPFAQRTLMWMAYGKPEKTE